MTKTSFCLIRAENEVLTETFVEAFVGRPIPVDILGKQYEGRVTKAIIIPDNKGVEIHAEY